MDIERQPEEAIEAPAETRAPESPRRSGHTAAKASEKKWKILFAFLVLASIGIVVAAVVIVTTRDGGGGAPTEELAGVRSTAPTPTPIDSPQEQLVILRAGLAANELTAEYLTILPQDANQLQGLASDESVDPVIRAASWLVLEDSLNQEDQLVSRFALAVLYFNNGGASWTNSQNWMSGNPICGDNGWYGALCGDSGEDEYHEFVDKVRELDLANNNLEGEIPESISLLTEMRLLRLNDNKLSGNLPGEALGSLPVLLIMYLQHNDFTGSVPNTLRMNGILGTYASLLYCDC
jgi:hypothetical protein